MCGDEAATKLAKLPLLPSVSAVITRKILFATGLLSATHTAPLRPGRRDTHEINFMSQHNSLRAAAGTTGAKRNVLKRFERVALLKARGQWKDGDRVVGLRKTLPPE